MSTYYQLDLQTLGSQPVMPQKISPIAVWETTGHFQANLAPEEMASKTPH